MFIDSRVRPPYKSYLDQAIYRKEHNRPWTSRFEVSYPAGHPDLTIDMMFQSMEDADVGIAMVAGRQSCGPTNNDDVTELAAAYPEKLRCFPDINPLHGEAALKEIDDRVINGPCAGVCMEFGFNPIGPMYANDRRAWPVYQKCEENNIPLYLSFGGFIGPDMSYCDPMLIEDVAQHFPDLRIMLAHGAYPFVQQACHLAMNQPNVYLAPDMYVFGVPGSRDYIDGGNTIIKEKLLFGSAYPIFDIKQSVEYYLKCGFKEDALEYIMYRNAAAFLGIEERTNSKEW